MNRLVIIGNGFDLAHGLPTSYSHFIDDFWSNFRDKVKTDEYQKFVKTNELYFRYYTDYGKIKNFTDFKSCIHENIKDYTNLHLDEKNMIFYANQNDGQKTVFEFKNEFFKIICKESSTLENWSGIEAIYYDLLKEIAIPEKSKYNYPHSIQKLNEELKDVKMLLIEYLKTNICENYSFVLDDSNEILKSLKDEINNSDIEKNETYLTYFLSFNYTPTARLYCESLKERLYKTEVNYIHGEISNDQNPYIIFGYGDIIDMDYKTLKTKSNDFLNNLKNHEYGSGGDNYENLIDFINSNKFKVIVMGHSCSLSDRYLLNHIFENTNCQKIKIYYRDYNDGEDNYKDLSNNISKHFIDDNLPNIRIENKKKSNPLFQKIRFEEKRNGSLS